MAQSYEAQRDRLVRLLWGATPLTVPDADAFAREVRRFALKQDPRYSPLPLPPERP